MLRCCAVSAVDTCARPALPLLTADTFPALYTTTAAHAQAAEATCLLVVVDSHASPLPSAPCATPSNPAITDLLSQLHTAYAAELHRPASPPPDSAVPQRMWPSQLHMAVYDGRALAPYFNTSSASASAASASVDAWLSADPKAVTEASARSERERRAREHSLCTQLQALQCGPAPGSTTASSSSSAASATAAAVTAPHSEQTGLCGGALGGVCLRVFAPADPAPQCLLDPEFQPKPSAEVYPASAEAGQWEVAGVVEWINARCGFHRQVTILIAL
jgi:hypothetical protein